MLIIWKVIFHFICSIGRFFRKLCHLIVGRRQEELGVSISRTEPVTLEHIRIISDMEHDDHRPYQSLASISKIPQPEWNSWGADDIFRQKQRSMLSSSSSALAEDPTHSIDYFSDIAATVKKTPKIVLKKRVNDKDLATPINHSRLQMTNDDLVDFQPGLTEWNDGDISSSNMTAGTWPDQDDFDGLSQEASEALRETRRIEREKKLREHQQRKLDKEASRPKRESLTS